MSFRTTMACVALALVAGVAGGYRYAVSHLTASEQPIAQPVVQSAGSGVQQRKVLYWHDPMYPAARFDRPGRSPFMAMDLVPVYADSDSSDSSGSSQDAPVITTSTSFQQTTSVRTATARLAKLDKSLRVLGNVIVDERQAAVVQARVDGYVKKLFVRVPYASVRMGEPLAEVVLPTWSAAFREYLTLSRNAALDPTVKANARDRLTQLGIPVTLIERVDATARFDGTVIMTAPRSGVVAEIGVRDGSALTPGTLLFRINGLDTVWIEAQVPESQSSRLHPHDAVAAQVATAGAASLPGRIEAILPAVDPIKRTRTVRIAMDNPARELVPGMSVELTISAAAEHEAVVVPAESLIRGSGPDRVVVALGGGRFQVQTVVAGEESQGMVEIVAGLAAGQSVVASGQFLIDAEASMRGSQLRLDVAAASE